MAAQNDYYGPFTQAQGPQILHLGVASSMMTHGINIIVTDANSNVVVPGAGTIQGEYLPVGQGTVEQGGIFTPFPQNTTLDLTESPVGWFPFDLQLLAIRLTPASLPSNLFYTVTITNNDP